MHPLLRSGIMGVLGFVLFALMWISLLGEDFATPYQAVSLGIYRKVLTHNPLFWWLGIASGTGFGIVSHIAGQRHRQHDKGKKVARVSHQDSADAPICLSM